MRLEEAVKKARATGRPWYVRRDGWSMGRASIVQEPDGRWYDAFGRPWVPDNQDRHAMEHAEDWFTIGEYGV